MFSSKTIRSLWGALGSFWGALWSLMGALGSLWVIFYHFDKIGRPIPSIWLSSPQPVIKK